MNHTHLVTHHSNSKLKTTRSGGRFSFLLFALLVAALASPVGRCRAGTGFPTVVTNGATFSIGVFEVMVDPSFAFLFAPAPGFTAYYPGYAGTNSGILTSPVMYDNNTIIGESVTHVRDSINPNPPYFPVAAGTGTGFNNYPPPNSSYSNIFNYAEYAFVPPVFTNGTDGVDEIMTEIEQLHLVGYVSQGQGVTNSPCPDPRVPSVPMSLVTVKAGPGNLGIGASLTANRRCLGMVQQITNGAADDFPAQSFFNMFVEVNLPFVPATAFPATGAVLYNDANNPLLIQNLYLTNLPPEATYVHGQTTAVPIRFRDNNPPYWSAGDTLGYLTLAGHGVFTNYITAQLPCAEATKAGGLLDQTLGPIGNPNPRPPIPWLRPTSAFPTPNTGYGSVVNRPVSSGVTNILDDTITFNLPSQFVVIRDINFGNLAGAIPLPAPLASSAYFNIQSTANICEISIQDGISDPGFYPCAGGSSVGSTSMTISNTASGNPDIYDIELMEYNGGGNIFGGNYTGASVLLRESPTLPSLGKHTVSPDPHGYRVGSFFDVFFELSLDGGSTWTPANKPIRLHPTMPPAVPQSLFVTRVFKQGLNTRMVLDWQNSFNLQSATNVLGPWLDVGTVVKGPFTNTVTPTTPLRYYRLRT